MSAILVGSAMFFSSVSFAQPPRLSLVVGDNAPLYSDGLMHGHGTHVWPNDKYYVGSWDRQRMSGLGVMVFADGRAPQRGRWQLGVFQDTDANARCTVS